MRGLPRRCQHSSGTGYANREEHCRLEKLGPAGRALVQALPEPVMPTSPVRVNEASYLSTFISRTPQALGLPGTLW